MKEWIKLKISKNRMSEYFVFVYVTGLAAAAVSIISFLSVGFFICLFVVDLLTVDCW